ncbi:2'-5' RNA ligase family protein [Paenibacillus dokdonensis]|uniref:2'-5' RNA ligase family protein n=1 Tax=Paenibacillus dokdonensis TaxID=2567944 RepID=A0ABU6GGF9_9BACL|nr:2'-5' RNA ligase family protein [Paenibacillus dokdonensis]MEC0238484.1 2'-5' RNA ligase family protein [Paenibacillus dokdonensis]
MYGVVVHFEQEIELVIKKIWRELSELSISSYAEEVINRKPHITLASYEDVNVDDFIYSFDNLFDRQPRFHLELSVLGTFIHSGTLFLTPTPSRVLLDIHAKLHKALGEYQTDSDLYLPGQWIPHCTIANRLSQDKLLEALNYCTNNMEMITALVNEVSIIKAEYQNNKCISAPAIYTKILK